MIDYEGMSPEELKEATQDIIRKADALNFMVRSPGWEILISTLEDKKRMQIEELLRISPGSSNEKDIIAAHTIAFTVSHMADDLVDSINRAIQEGYAVQLESRSEEEAWSE